MKIKELIENLSKFNPNTEIIILNEIQDFAELTSIIQKDVIKEEVAWNDELDEEELDEEINIIILS
ncbi:MAG TPA: hypothetical protein VF849_00120 [Blattabacteriaceae bacterium]